MNEKQKKWKLILAGLMAGLLIGGTVAVTTPSVAAGPAKVWKQIKKKADKRYYTKKKSDKRYAAKPTVIRGNWGYAITAGANPSQEFLATGISFGVTLPGSPTSHYIDKGAVVPPGCGGTVIAPTASPGHLCVFEGQKTNVDPGSLTSGDGTGAVDPSGALVFTSPVATGKAFAYGTWAVGTGPDAVWGKVTTKTTSVRPAGR